jgi:cell division protein FtsQ
MGNRVHWIWLPIILVFIVLIFQGIDYRKNKRIAKHIIEIENLTEGKSLISAQEIERILMRAMGRNAFGLKIEDIQTEFIEKALLEEPMIANAKVYFDSKNHLRIKVQQREPLVRILDKTGMSYYLDFDGKRFPVSKHFTARVPIITGDIEVFKEDFLYLENFNLKHVFLLARDLSQSEFFKALAEQYVIKGDGTIIIVPKWGDEEIVFGNYGEVDEKLENLMVYYKQIQPALGWKKYKSINLSFKGQIVCVNT